MLRAKPLPFLHLGQSASFNPGQAASTPSSGDLVSPLLPYAQFMIDSPPTEESRSLGELKPMPDDTDSIGTALRLMRILSDEPAKERLPHPRQEWVTQSSTAESKEGLSRESSTSSQREAPHIQTSMAESKEELSRESSTSSQPASPSGHPLHYYKYSVEPLPPGLYTPYASSSAATSSSVSPDKFFSSKALQARSDAGFLLEPGPTEALQAEEVATEVAASDVPRSEDVVEVPRRGSILFVPSTSETFINFVLDEPVEPEQPAQDLAQELQFQFEEDEMPRLKR